VLPRKQTDVTGMSRCGASAPRVLRQAAELVPDQLNFSAFMTVHACGVFVACQATGPYVRSDWGPRSH
jgi:hypothetical protein